MTGRRRSPRPAVLALAVAPLLSSVGCGGGGGSGGAVSGEAFVVPRTDDPAGNAECSRAPAAVPRGAGVVVGVVDPQHLVGTTLPAGPVWKFDHALDGRPQVAGSVVVGTGAGEIFALEGSTGRRLWAIPAPEQTLRGAGDDGTTTVLTVGSSRGGASLLAVSRAGAVVSRIDTDKDLGAPAAAGGRAYVPWGNQYLSVVDLARGRELCRVLTREKVSRAWAEEGSIHFGEIGIFRMDEHVAGAVQGKATHVTVATRELPGTPRLMVPGSDRVPVVANAGDKVHVYVRPAAPDRIYATYFRLVMGLDGKGHPVWVQTRADDVLAGAAVPAGLVTCAATGVLEVLSASGGAVVAHHSLGTPVRACVVGHDAQVTGTASAPPLARQMETALLTNDPELLAAQRYLLKDLSTLPDEGATQTLLSIAGGRQTPPDLRREARAALAGRRSGAPFMLKALERHVDFLEDIAEPPPAGPLAQALAAMNEKRAAPLLASHLLDPSTAPADARDVAQALLTLGSAAEVPALRQFFALYRASAEDDDTSVALGYVAEGLLKLGGEAGKAQVSKAVKDPLTLPGVFPRLEGALQAK